MIVFLAAIAFCQSALASDRCKVTDPTGTPLNLRDTPNGEIIGSIRNGIIVLIQDNAQDNRGRSWVLISSSSGTTLGWVFREFISCY